MNKLISIDEYPVRNVLKMLLSDKTTGQNIRFATDAYSDVGIHAKTQITEEILFGSDPLLLQPRVCKSLSEQADRTKKKAEVFTPAWICNKMNNHCDTEWFGQEGIFNTEREQDWEPTSDPVPFDSKKTWQQYIDSRRLEITCGEAPYIASRYDAATGEPIPVGRRIGILDRKLRVVNENTDNERDWTRWSVRAFQSVYGFEYQGDSLLFARINLVMTLAEYMQERWGKAPDLSLVTKIANIVAWNLWQMDGITGTVPYGMPVKQITQYSFFDNVQVEQEPKPGDVDCMIYDWRSRRPVTYRSIKEHDHDTADKRNGEGVAK
ncbi:MAG: restriction endonuclease subunit M [Lachnospiraceae bacterium]|nr:restriction endonuclease subunit M [Lachnospiraceae bacterium]